MKPEVAAEVEAAWATERARTTYPTEGGGTVSVEHDLCPDRYRREVATLFHGTWIPIARESELQGAGAFVTRTVAGVPLALVRSDAVTIRAFRNVCPHRGAQILREPSGCTDALRCSYHGLTFGLDGAYRGRVSAATFGDRAESPPLDEWRCEAWGGWLWVAAPTCTEELRAFLGEDLLDELSAWPFDEVDRVQRRDLEVDFGWKVGVEAFLEPLHLPSIHGSSAHAVIDHRATAIRALGEHSRMATPFRSPGAYGPQGVLGATAHAAGMGPFVDLNDVQRGSNLSYLIFPSTILSLLPNHFTVFQLLPLGVGRAQLRYELYAGPARDERGRDYQADLIPGYAQLLREDVDQLPWIQRGLEGGAGPELHLSWLERRIPWFRDAIERRLGG